jgi:tetratricopeptide (TPR) repeat protein
MDPKTNKLLQQAGKYILLGKLTLALEEYLKIHDLEPEDTTITNTIGDLYVRLDDKENALIWYHKLAETFEFRELHSNAMATYRKILKLSPKNHEAMNLLAQLYERQGQVQNAKVQYQMLAKLKAGLNEQAEAIAILKKVCKLDPLCADSRINLAQALEQIGSMQEALEGYLEGAATLAKQCNLMAAAQAVEHIFRLQPHDKEFVKSFFLLLQKINLTERGLEYLESLSLNEDPEFRLILSEMFLQQDNFEAAQKLVQGRVRQCPTLYKPAIRILQELIQRQELEASLDMVEDLFETSIRLKDETTLKVLLDSLVELDASNVRVLKTLTAILIRMNDKKKLEGYLKRLVILQLRADEIREARETLNKLVVYGKSSFYLDLLNMINEATVESNLAALQITAQKLIQALERGSFEANGDPMAHVGLALGVSELDLGMGMAMGEVELLQETTCTR